MPRATRARDDRGGARRPAGRPRDDEDYDDEYVDDEYDQDEEYDEDDDRGDGGEPEEAGRGGRAAAGPRRQPEPRRGTMPAAVAAKTALQHVVERTGKQTSGVTSLEQVDGGWVVGVEVVEDRRIPSSTDILAVYLAEVDADGSLRAYHRVRRYQRGRGDDSEGQQ